MLDLGVTGDQSHTRNARPSRGVTDRPSPNLVPSTSEGIEGSSATPPHEATVTVHKQQTSPKTRQAGGC
jgi:hypothetical protein